MIMLNANQPGRPVMLYMGISSAFNITDTDKSLCIAHDLRYPEDAIQVIAELNNDVVTKIGLYSLQLCTDSTATETAPR